MTLCAKLSSGEEDCNDRQLTIDIFFYIKKAHLSLRLRWAYNKKQYENS